MMPTSKQATPHGTEGCKPMTDQTDFVTFAEAREQDLVIDPQSGEWYDPKTYTHYPRYDDDVRAAIQDRSNS